MRATPWLLEAVGRKNWTFVFNLIFLDSAFSLYFLKSGFFFFLAFLYTLLYLVFAMVPCCRLGNRCLARSGDLSENTPAHWYQSRARPVPLELRGEFLLLSGLVASVLLFPGTSATTTHVSIRDQLHKRHRCKCPHCGAPKMPRCRV